MTQSTGMESAIYTCKLHVSKLFDIRYTIRKHNIQLVLRAVKICHFTCKLHVPKLFDIPLWKETNAIYGIFLQAEKLKILR